MVNVSIVEPVVELLKKTSTDLPADIEEALIKACDNEESGSAAKSVLSTILENVDLARNSSTPICQDTGTPIFYIHYPPVYSTLDMKRQIEKSLVIATEKSFLRPNAVDSLSGKNSGNNLGRGFPTTHFEEWENDFLKIDLMLKGGGSENVGIQYSLPYTQLDADRDINGIKKVVLDAIHKAQGKGCAPGIIGVGIGGDRESSTRLAKKQLFRKLYDRNPDEALQKIEEELLDKANQLGIGPMGFGGKTTILSLKADYMHRLPASYFVSIAYMCWACRRRSLTYKEGVVEID